VFLTGNDYECGERRVIRKKFRLDGDFRLEE